MPLHRHFEPQQIGTVLSTLIDEWGIRQKLDEAEAISMWPTVAGGAIRRQTMGVHMKNGRMTIKIRNAVWRHELQMQRSQWCARINKALGKETVAEVVFR